MTAYQLLPPLRDHELAELTASIKQFGVQVPVHLDEDGNIIDGHHRVMIADSLDIPYQKVVVCNRSHHEKRILSAHLNASRRQLDDGQKIALGRKIEPDIAAMARERQEQLGRSNGGDPLGTNVPKGRTRDEVAAAVGLGSGRTYERGKKLLEAIEQEPDGAETVAKIESGELPLAEASKQQARRNRERRNQTLAAQSQEPTPPSLKRYPVIYADPPWKYEHSRTDNRAIENQYPTMDAGDIARLDPPGADDSVLFMWATNPKLLEAFAVLDAWGYEYKTNMVWVKDKIGMGYYARQRHELLLIATRGTPPTPMESARPDSVIEAPRSRHSEKPPVVYELIEQMYPGFAKLEMFARCQIPGWDSWGYEAGNE